MPAPRGRTRLERGKSLGAQVARLHPVGRIAMGLAGAVRGGHPVAAKRHRSRGMHIRKGRLFMAFTQKEVKAAMHRTYGGHRRKK